MPTITFQQRFNVAEARYMLIGIQWMFFVGSIKAYHSTPWVQEYCHAGLAGIWTKSQAGTFLWSFVHFVLLNWFDWLIDWFDWSNSADWLIWLIQFDWLIDLIDLMIWLVDLAVCWLILGPKINLEKIQKKWCPLDVFLFTKNINFKSEIVISQNKRFNLHWSLVFSDYISNLWGWEKSKIHQRKDWSLFMIFFNRFIKIFFLKFFCDRFEKKPFFSVFFVVLVWEYSTGRRATAGTDRGEALEFAPERYGHLRGELRKKRELSYDSDAEIPPPACSQGEKTATAKDLAGLAHNLDPEETHRLELVKLALNVLK